jgi:thiamine-phosphate pyrophosphorylase
VAGSARIVGKSTHTLEQARCAFTEGPDYVAVGPMFDSATKPQDHIAGPKTLRAVAAETSLPLVAIGGITPEHVPAVVEAGARCLCGCAAIISNPHPQESAAALKRALNDARTIRISQSEPQAPAPG